MSDQLLPPDLPPDETALLPAPRRRGRPRKDAGAAGADASSTAADQPVRRRRRRAPAMSAEAIGTEVTAKLAVLGSQLAMVAPITGTTMLMRAEMAGKGVTAVCEDNERVREAIARLMKVDNYAALAIFGVSMLVAVGVEVGAVKPTALPALVIADVLQRVSPPAESNGSEPTIPVPGMAYGGAPVGDLNQSAEALANVG